MKISRHLLKIYLYILFIIVFSIILFSCNTTNNANPEDISKNLEKENNEEHPPVFIISFDCDITYGCLEGETHQSVKKGNYSSKVKAIAKIGYQFDCWSNGDTNNPISISPTSDLNITAIFKKKDFTFPVMEIFTDDDFATINKELWTNCTINVSNTIEEHEFFNSNARIKGRGNSTWEMPKRPYKIKFDSKIDLFGNGKSKNWVLLANYDDPSVLRNHLAFETARLFDDLADITTTTQFVNLYANDEYQGLYQVCEQNETGKNRVDIDTDTSKVDTGYLLEMHSWVLNDGGILDINCFQVGPNYYAIKDPDPDDKLTLEQTAFIKNYVIDAYNAVIGTDYSIAETYIDMNSFASMYVVQEIFKSVDLGKLSMFYYKDAGGKLCSGPPWDFDITAGNCDYDENAIDYNFLFAKETNVWYKNLLKFDEFKQFVCEKLSEVKDDIIKLYGSIKKDMLIHKIDVDENFNKWETIGVYVWPNTQEIVDIKTWEGQVDYLVDWLTNSVNNIIGVYCDC